MRILFYCRNYNEIIKNLQPWHYIIRLAEGLALKGHNVSFVSSARHKFIIYNFKRQDDLSIAMIENGILENKEEFADFISKERIGIIITSIGPLSSLKRNEFNQFNGLCIGIVTFPLYKLREILNAGFLLLFREWRNSYQHFFGAIIQSISIKKWKKGFDLIIAESEHNRKEMIRKGIDPNRILLLRPGVDNIFLKNSSFTPIKSETDKRIIIYMGSPNRLRGAQDLISIWSNITRVDKRARLRLLIRQDENSGNETSILKTATKRDNRIEIITENLTRGEIKRHFSEASAIVFPFRLVPSEMPVGPLEAISSGCRIIVPELDGLSELREFGAMVYPPGDLEALANMIIYSISDSISTRIPDKRELPSWHDISCDLERHLFTISD